MASVETISPAFKFLQDPLSPGHPTHNPSTPPRPPRPPRSPLRPLFGSIKRKRASAEREKRASSESGGAGVNGLRQRLREFRDSLRSTELHEGVLSFSTSPCEMASTVEESSAGRTDGIASQTEHNAGRIVDQGPKQHALNHSFAAFEDAAGPSNMPVDRSKRLSLVPPGETVQPIFALPSPPITPSAPLTPPDPRLPPEVRIIKPSLPPEAVVQASGMNSMHPFAAVVALMDGASEGSAKGKERAPGERPRAPNPQGLTGLARPLAHTSSKTSLRIKPSTFKTSSLQPIPPTPITSLPSSVTLLHPVPAALFRSAPATPLLTHGAGMRFAMSTSHTPSPSPTRMPTPICATASFDAEMVEIPRFKKKELNLAMVEQGGPWQRLAWCGLWAVWMVNGLSSLYFDVNVIYILIQCVIHPSFSTNSSKSWTFVAVAYALCLGLSTIVWLAWELGYEYWRRWRLARPAIEPIHLSLPAALHLSLTSYPHFRFLLYIRLSPLKTPHSKDILPETCHALAQLAPGLLPLLPRAGIAVAILIAFAKPAADVQSPFGSTDQVDNRDPRFFRADHVGELTSYAKGVVFAFVAYVGFRLVIVISSLFGLWVFSGRPLGGLIGKRWRAGGRGVTPITPQKPKSSIIPRDPSQTTSPQKNWLDAENEFDWAWRDRTRARIQDAFELCMIRTNVSIGPTLRGTGASQLAGGRSGPVEEREVDVFLANFTGNRIDAEGVLIATARPESGVLPVEMSRGKTPSNTPSASSSRDMFYTPADTPMVERGVPPTSYRHKATEFGERRNSEGSMESITDDSVGLLTATSTPRTSVLGLRERAGSTGAGRGSAPEPTSASTSSRSSSRKRAASGPSLYRARSTSVSMLRGSVMNAAATNNLVRRVRSGTLSGESQYSRVSEDLGGMQEVTRRRSRLGLSQSVEQSITDKT